MSRRPARRVGTGHLLRRQVLTDSSAVLTVALIVLVTAALAAAVPRLLDALQTDGARAAVAGTGPLQRDLAATVFAAPPTGRGPEPLAPAHRLLDAVAGRMPPLVRDRLGAPALSVDFRDLGVSGVEPRLPSQADTSFLELSMQSGYTDHVRFVAGGPPQQVRVEPRPDAPVSDTQTLPPSVTDRGELEVAVSTRTAAALGLDVGSRVRITEVDLTLVVSGVFEAVAPDDGYWGFDTRVLTPQQNYSSALGVYVTGVALFPEQAYPQVERLLGGVRSPVTLLRFPVSGGGLEAGQVADLLAQVRQVEGTTFAAPARRLTDGPFFAESMTTFRVATDLDAVLAEHLRQRAASTAVVSLVVSGLLGACLAVLALAGRLVVERRQRSLALAVARGASPAQLRVLTALEGLVLGVPAAAAGWLAAAAVVPGDGGVPGLALPLLLGLAPAVLLPLLARPGGLRVERRDVGRVRGRRLRVAGEVLAVLAAAGALLLVRSRGLATGAADTGVDPLLAASPLLLALAGALLLARLYPLPVAALTAALGRRRAAVSFLGAARAGRDAPAGTLPLVVLLLALATAVFGAVVSATTARGAGLAAAQTVGADARLASLGFDDAELAAGAGTEGVEAVAGVGDLPAEVRTDRSTEEVTLVAADAAALAEVQAGLPGAPDYPAALWAAGDRLPVLVQAGVAAVGEEVQLGTGSRTVAAVVVGTASGDLPSVLTARRWVVADRALLLEAGGDAPLASTALVALTGGTARAGLEADLREAMGTFSPLLTRQAAVERAGEAPLVSGTLAAFGVAAAVAAALAALGVVLTLVVTAPARSRVLSRLRTLGLSPRQAQGLAVWEVAPLAATSLVAGLLLGLAVPWLVAPAVDLRPFTGGTAAPPYTVGTGGVAAIAAGFVLLITVAVTLTVASNRRLRLGAVLRVGEEQ